jgi:hypothetical protein
MSVANYVETAAMIDSARDPVVSRQLDNLITQAGLALVPVTTISFIPMWCPPNATWTGTSGRAWAR